jgi:hypothetical protein
MVCLVSLIGGRGVRRYWSANERVIGMARGIRNDILSDFDKAFPGKFMYSEHPTPSTGRWLFQSPDVVFTTVEATEDYMIAMVNLHRAGVEYNAASEKLSAATEKGFE